LPPSRWLGSTGAASAGGERREPGFGSGVAGRTELPGYSGDFDHFAVDLEGNRLFLAAEDHGTLEVFDLHTGKHLRSVKVSTPPQHLPNPADGIGC